MDESVYKLFTGELGKQHHLKDRFKPIYYALMYFMKDKYPNEYLKVGAELKETVEEVIKEIEVLRNSETLLKEFMEQAQS